MDFRGDERAQPVVIGSLLIFAILVLAFSGYQAFVVPNQNADVEFQHSQQVQDDMVDLRVGIVRAAISGSHTSTSVQLGTQYPTRLIALNPPPPAATLQTTEAEDIVIDSSNPQEQTDICLSPGTTRMLIYEPGYHEFQDGPAVVYENTVAYSQYRNDDTELIRTNQRLLDSEDEVIELIALEGEYSESGINRVDIDFIRGETQSENLTNPEITVPTEVTNQTTWEEDILGGQATIVTFESGESVTFSVTGTYEVRCTPVGINKAPESGSSNIGRTSNSGDGGNNGGSGGGVQEDRSAEFAGDVEAEPTQASNSRINEITFTFNTTSDSEVQEIYFEAFENDVNGVEVGNATGGPSDSPFVLPIDGVNYNSNDVFVRVTLTPSSGPEQVCTGTIENASDTSVLNCN